ncbi:MAG: hypothetical protein M9899_07715 [Bdellovibrionaceae bacterium]|nr:hypothetical protein [Pseudobdellovibrionaceae bacterium]
MSKNINPQDFQDQPQKWALFFSGRGNNMRALLRVHPEGAPRPFLVCNNAKAEGIAKAKELGYEPHLIKAPYDYKALAQLLQEQGVTHIFLLGYMRIVPSSFASQWANRIFNLHPSLLPLYPGLDSIKRAFLNHDDIGVTIHHVTEGVDEGEAVMQKCVFPKGSYSHMTFSEVEDFVHRWEYQMVTEFYLNTLQGQQT